MSSIEWTSGSSTTANGNIYYCGVDPAKIEVEEDDDMLNDLLIDFDNEEVEEEKSRLLFDPGELYD